MPTGPRGNRFGPGRRFAGSGQRAGDDQSSSFRGLPAGAEGEGGGIAGRRRVR